jgi:hypothetical protein
MDDATTMLLPGTVGLSCVAVMTVIRRQVHSVMMHRKADLLRKSSAKRRDSVGIR